MIVARKRDKSDDPKMYVGDLPSSYAVQIIEKDANGHEVQYKIENKHSLWNLIPIFKSRSFVHPS